MSILTGNRDPDLVILSNLDDRSLFNFCLTNKSANQLCKRESFWMNRFIKKFGQEASTYKPKNRTWRNHYLKVVSDLDYFSEDPWGFFESIDSWNLYDSDLDKLFPEDQDERLHNAYWMLDLGKEVILEFPLEPFQEIELLDKKYTSSTKLTPHDVLEHIYKFYQEPVSLEEWRLHENNIFAQDFTEDDVINGTVQRIDLLNNPSFLGIFRLPEQDGINHVYIQISVGG